MQQARRTARSRRATTALAAARRGSSSYRGMRGGLCLCMCAGAVVREPRWSHDRFAVCIVPELRSNDVRRRCALQLIPRKCFAAAAGAGWGGWGPGGGRGERDVSGKLGVRARDAHEIVRLQIAERVAAEEYRVQYYAVRPHVRRLRRHRHVLEGSRRLQSPAFSEEITIGDTLRLTQA